MQKELQRIKSNPNPIIWNTKVFLSYLRNGIIILLKALFVYKNPGAFISNYFLHRQKTLLLRNGLKFKSTPQNRCTINEVFVLKIYEKKNYSIEKEDVVVDIGAAIGAFSIYAANIAKSGRVFCVEPLKEHFDLLNENIAINGLKNVTTFNLALADSCGVRKINVQGTASSFYWSKQGETRSIMTMTLESFLKDNSIKKVNFLKMDCEGAEFEIFLNLTGNILKKIQKIAMEYHNLSPEKNVSIIKAHLEESGFQVEIMDGKWNGLLFARAKEWQSST